MLWQVRPNDRHWQDDCCVHAADPEPRITLHIFQLQRELPFDQGVSLEQMRTNRVTGTLVHGK